MGNTADSAAAKIENRSQRSARNATPRFRFSMRPESVLSQEAFHSTLMLERRRAERSRKPFVLMVIDGKGANLNGNGPAAFGQIASILSESTRETDIIGWHESSATLGVIFTEISDSGAQVSVPDMLRAKIEQALAKGLDKKYAAKLVITIHTFPQVLDKDGGDQSTDARLYPDLSQGAKKRLPLILKRAMDVVGSAILLLLLSPVLLLIALLIKLTSKGPVLFRQERLGEFGRTFQCLKFRTMSVDNDPKIHREYVRNLIAGKAAGSEKNSSEPAVYKIKNDPRVTPVGRILRKTSLDELPQFFNVLLGEMSLVGPRPPVRYEFEVYDFWHRRRVLEVKPGVTGLWQVSGRSRMCFDDMVRLDLRYSQTWSLWLDLRILVATPRAVFTGDGAF